MSIRMKDFDALVTQHDIVQLEKSLERKLNQLMTAFNDLQAEVIRRDPKTEVRKEFYTTAEFAKLVGVSRNTVIRRCQEGTIQSTQPGGYGTGILIPVQEFERWKEEAKLVW